MMSLAETVVAEARSWVGTPFFKEAALKGIGTDCIQLSRSIYLATGIAPPTIPDFLPYPAGWLLERGDTRYRDAISTYATCVWERTAGLPRSEGLAAVATLVRPADMLLFRIGRADAHSAIVTEWPLVIHADSTIGCVVEVNVTRNELGSRVLSSLWRAQVLL